MPMLTNACANNRPQAHHNCPRTPSFVAVGVMMFELTLVSPWKNKRRRATRDRVGLAPNFNTRDRLRDRSTLHPDPARKVGNLNT